MRQGIICAIVVIATVMTVPLAGTRSSSSPTGHSREAPDRLAVLGPADWKAVDGELIGTPKSPEGGWLVSTNRFRTSSSAPTSSASAVQDRSAAARREDADGDEGHLSLAQRGRGRRLCGDARRQRQGTDARAPAPRRRADARRANGRRSGGRGRGARAAPGGARRCAGAGPLARQARRRARPAAAARLEPAADAVCCPRARRCPN